MFLYFSFLLFLDGAFCFFIIIIIIIIIYYCYYYYYYHYLLIIMYSLRRKELFWQYKLGLFTPNGLNERAADVELDIFACGTA